MGCYAQFWAFGPSYADVTEIRAMKPRDQRALIRAVAASLGVDLIAPLDGGRFGASLVRAPNRRSGAF